MKKLIIITIIVSFYSLGLLAQPEYGNPLNFDFLESTSERDKFLMYIDSIDKYLYKDGQLAEKILLECEAIIKTDEHQLTNADILNYAIQKIYTEQNNSNFLNCYAIIKQYEHLLDDESILEKIKDKFRYIRAFTYLSLEDLVAAQEAFYEILEKGRSKKDSSLIVRGLYSLGQLYGDEKEYESAIKYLKEIQSIAKSFKIRPGTLALVDFELGEIYIDTKQYEEANQVIKKGISFLDDQKINRLKPDFLLLQCKILLAQNKLIEVETIFQKMNEQAKENNDAYAITNSKLLHAELLNKQRKYHQSFEIYQNVLEEIDSNALRRLSNIYEKTRVVLYHMEDHATSNLYWKKQRKIENKIKNKNKEKQLAYLKIKFESEQREKENQVLAISVLEEQNRNRLLYSISIIFLLGLLLLYGAFHQNKKYNVRLQKEVNKQTKDLASSNKNLAQSNEELKRFAFIFSHDLKTPLQNIINFTDLLEEEVKPYSNEIPLSYLHFIKKGGKRMNQLLNDSIKFTQLSFMEKERIQEVIDLNKLLIDLKQSMINYLEKRNAIIIVERPLPTIQGDSALLNLIFKILIENALKYNESDSPKVKIYSNENLKYNSIFFEDNGIGIPIEYHRQIFVMFKKLHNNNKYEGTGLGLAICKKIIEQLNGEILLESEVNKGSIFEIRWPKKIVFSK